MSQYDPYLESPHTIGRACCCLGEAETTPFLCTYMEHVAATIPKLCKRILVHFYAVACVDSLQEQNTRCDIEN